MLCKNSDATDVERTIETSIDSQELSKDKDKKTKKRKYGTLRANDSQSSARTSYASNSSQSSGNNIDLLARRNVTTTKADKSTVFAENDIRGKYSEIFCEAFNNFDKQMFSQLMRDFCEEDLVVIYEYVGVNAYNSPKYLEVRGLDTVAVFWDSMFTSMPDSLFAIYSTKYKILPNHFTSIVCTFSFKGTKVYELKGLNGELKEQNVVLSTEPPTPIATSAGLSVLQSSQQSFDNQVIVTSFKPTSKKPLSEAEKGKLKPSPTAEVKEQPFDIERSEMISRFITVIGTLTYYVNPNKKIYQMSFVHSVKQ